LVLYWSSGNDYSFKDSLYDKLIVLACVREQSWKGNQLWVRDFCSKRGMMFEYKSNFLKKQKKRDLCFINPHIHFYHINLADFLTAGIHINLIVTENSWMNYCIYFFFILFDLLLKKNVSIFVACIVIKKICDFTM